MRGRIASLWVSSALLTLGCGGEPARPVAPRPEVAPDAGSTSEAPAPVGEPAAEPAPGAVLGWAVSFGGLADEWPHAVAAMPDGSAVLVGAFFDEMDFDPSDGVVLGGSAGSLDGFVSALDAHGGLRWAGTLGGGGDDEADAVELFDDGSAVLAGSFAGTADLDPGPRRDDRTSAGGEDGFVLRLDVEGGLLWALTIGGAGDDGVEDVAVGPSGEVAAVGQLYDRVDLDPGPGTDERRAAGGRDAFVLLLDSTGARRWAAVLGGSGEDFCTAVAFAPDGGLVVGGRFDQSADFDPGPGRSELVSTGSEDDAWIARLEPDGSLGWARSIGGPGRDVVTDLAAGPDGSIVAVGGFYGAADLDPGPGRVEARSRGGRDIFVLRLDRDGGLVWARSFGGPEDDWVDGVALSEVSGIALAGSHDEKVDFDPGPGVAEPRVEGGRDAFVLRLDGDGAFDWLWTLAGAGHDFALSVTFAGDRSVVAGGGFTGEPDFDPGPTSLLRPAAGRRDGFALRLFDGP